MTIVVTEKKPAETDADKNDVIGQDLIVEKGASVDPKDAIKNLDDLVNVDKVTFKDKLDTSVVGEKEVVVVVTYKDGSADQVTVRVKVVEGKQPADKKPGTKDNTVSPKTSDDFILPQIAMLLVALVALLLIAKKKKQVQ